MSLTDQQWCPTSVQVTVLQARGLRIKGKNGTNDAYAVMQVGKEKFQTSVVEKSVTPVWKEEATFDLPQLLQAGGKGPDRSTLHVHVLHRALVGPDKQLGQAVINLLQLSEDKSREKTEWFKLLDKTGKPDKERGEVLLDVQFMRNNMTASMFDLSAAGKSRSRLGKIKDKVRGKKKESDSASSIVPSLTQVLTDSEEEGDAEGREGKDGKSKKHKMKSLFSPKSNLQKNMSQSMSVLPGKNSSLSGSQSSGLNVDSSEGKKKFKFSLHKRSGSSDGKNSSFGHQKQAPVEQSNLCINGSHVYCEEQQPRTTRAGSNFSLISSGHGSMEDVPENSPPSVDSLKAVREYSPWMEEEEEEEEEEEAENENDQEDADESRKEEEERIKMEEERRKNEETLRRREDLEKFEKEKLRREEEMRLEAQREEEERKREEEMRKQQEELQRLAEKLREERAKREEEEKMAQRMEEERKRKEEEKEMLRQQAELERLAKEEKLKQEEEERRNVQREEEEKARQEEEERKAEEEQNRLAEDMKKLEEEKRQREEEDRINREEEEKKAQERKIQEEEEHRLAEEKGLEEEEKERVRRENERAEEERRQKEELLRKQEQQRRQMEEERASKEREEQEKLMEEKRVEAEEKNRKDEEERAKMEEEQRQREQQEEERSREEGMLRTREELEKLAQEEENRREAERVKEERIQKEEARRQEEERVRIEEARRQEEERLRIEEARRREEERVRIEEARRREEERVRIEEARRREEERVRIEEAKRQEEERVRIEEAKRQEEERVRIEEAKRQEEERGRKEEARRQEEERGRKEEARRREEEERVRKDEARRQEEEERVRKDEARRQEEERVRKEEERRQEEERIRKEREENERLEEERRRLEEQEKRRIEEMERIKKEEQEMIRKEEKKREERARKEKEELDRIRNQEEQEKRRKEEEESVRKEEMERKEAEENQKETKTINEQKVAKKKLKIIPTEILSTNPFDEDFSPSESSSNSAPEPPICSTKSETVQRCPSAVPSATSVSAEEKDLINAQREKRPAPQPPGRGQPEKPRRDLSALQQINKQSKEKDVRTVSVPPQRSVQMIAPLNSSSTKRPAPTRPLSVEEEPPSANKTSLRGVSETKPVKTVHSLNPFDDDENELAGQDEGTKPGTGPFHWPPADPQTADKDDASQAKVKSLKVARAPAPPPPNDSSSSPLINPNDGGPLTGGPDLTTPNQACDPEPEGNMVTQVQESPNKDTQPAKGQKMMVAGVKEEGPPVNSRRLQTVKPLNPLEQQPAAVHEENDKSSGLDCTKAQHNTKVITGPYSQLTREELISLVLKQEKQLADKDKKISELELYIDNLLVRVIEVQPSILMSMSSMK